MYRRIRFIQKMFEMGQLAWEKVNNTMQSYFGLISHFTAGNLLRKIIDEFSFRVQITIHSLAFYRVIFV